VSEEQRKEELSIDERVKLTNLYTQEIGIRIRAKKHLTIGYVWGMLDDFIRRAYAEGKKAGRG
jgi:hypothetical protein